ncbi:MAG: VOC family protein [Verrucomicrobiota bacterium]
MSVEQNAVGWFEIYVADLERAKGFYEATFEIQLVELPAPEAEGVPPVKMLAFPSDQEKFLPGAAGAICQMEGVEPGVGGTLVYFQCQDCAHNAALAEKAGGKIQAPKFSIGQYGFISMVEDTEGNTIGLHSRE